MKIEHQICSLEHSEKFKKLGIKQRSLFFWSKDWFSKEWQIQFANNKTIPHEDCYSAFTIAELLNMLPECIYESYDLLIGKRDNLFRIEYLEILTGNTFQEGEILYFFEEKNIANCASQMLLQLIEKNLITIEEINK